MSRPVVSRRGTLKQERDTQAVRYAKSDALMFGSSLADVFRTPAYDCRAVGSDQKPEFAVTRLRSGPRELEKAPAYPPDQAALICVSLTPSAIGQWQALYNGKKVGVTRAIPFAATFIDLNCRMEMWVRGPFDYLHYYLSQGLLERIAFDNGISTSFCLQEAFFIEDLVVAQMTKNILTPVEHGEPLDRLALDQIAMVLALIRYRRIAARQSSQPDQGAGWKRGKSCKPRRCCGRILKEISRSRNSRARVHFRTVISRGASAQVLARRSISASFNFGSSGQKTCFQGPVNLSSRLHCYPASAIRPPLPGASAAWNT